jgi:uncharacterized protein YjiS (DUF1127 family)
LKPFSPRHDIKLKRTGSICNDQSTDSPDGEVAKQMESTVASRPITHQEFQAPRGGAASIIRKLMALVRASKAYGIWHDIRVLEGLARKPDAAAQPRSLSAWLGGLAARVAHAIAQEARIRRDTRHLRLMSDQMLEDIGLTRAEISGAVRYGRD